MNNRDYLTKLMISLENEMKLIVYKLNSLIYLISIS